MISLLEPVFNVVNIADTELNIHMDFGLRVFNYEMRIRGYMHVYAVAYEGKSPKKLKNVYWEVDSKELTINNVVVFRTPYKHELENDGFAEASSAQLEETLSKVIHSLDATSVETDAEMEQLLVDEFISAINGHGEDA